MRGRTRERIRRQCPPGPRRRAGFGGGRAWRALCLAGLAGMLALPSPAHEGAHGGVPEAPAAPARLFEPPAPGSYELPPIDRVREHRLLDVSGQRAPLLDLAEHQVAVVAFVYRSCAQASGCPLALAVLQRLDRELASRPELAGRVRLVTVSFDPERDTPERMREFRDLLAPRSDWRFLTGASASELAPVLADYGQDLRWLPGPDGAGPVAGHVLRVYLVDAERAVRNVYSAGFLDAEILRNDAATVLGVAMGSAPPVPDEAR